MLEKYDRVVRIGFIWIKTGAVTGSCEHGNEHSGSINFWEIFERLRD
jgi:hypothetical protein